MFLLGHNMCVCVCVHVAGLRDLLSSVNIDLSCYAIELGRHLAGNQRTSHFSSYHC